MASFSIGTIIAAVAVLAVLALNFRRAQRPRPLKVAVLWVRPLILAGLMALAFWVLPAPRNLMDVGLLGAACAIGIGFGWFRARALKLDVHPESGEIMQQPSPLSIVLLVGLVLFRFVLRGVNGAAMQSPTYIEALLLFGGGLIVSGNLTTWLRARAVLRAAQDPTKVF